MAGPRYWDKLEVSVRDSPYVIVSMGTRGFTSGMEALSADCERLGLSLLLWQVSGSDSRCVCDLKPQVLHESLWHAGMPCVWIDADDTLLEAPRLTTGQFKSADVILADNPELAIIHTHLTFACFFGVAASDGGRNFVRQWQECTATTDLFGAAHRDHDHRALHMAYFMVYGRSKSRCVFLNATESFRGCVRLNCSATSVRGENVVL